MAVFNVCRRSATSSELLQVKLEQKQSLAGIAGLLLSLTCFGGCATSTKTTAERPNKNIEIAKTSDLSPSLKNPDERGSPPLDRPSDPKPADEGGGAPTGGGSKVQMSVRGVQLKNTKFDYPIVINSRVEFWIDYFTGRGRIHFEKYLERSEYFIPYISPLLRSNRMPEDLVYLAMIESGFNNWARSSARAVGPWQFMSATGKRYGLSVNWWIDERKDIKKSTLAAVEYLRDLYGIFGSWELAAAAYNAGEAKIARAVQRYGTKDFWTLSRGRFLRPETRDYVPKIMAAAIIGKNREQFGFMTHGQRPRKDETIAPDGSLVKIESAAAEAEKKNDPSRSGEKSGSQGSDGASKIAQDSAEDPADPETIADILAEMPEPEQSKDATKGALAGAGSPAGSSRNQNAPLARPIAHPVMTKSGEVTGEEIIEFEVKSPADLLKIAEAAGLSYATVKGLNPEVLRWCTPPTQGAYRIRLPATSRDTFLLNYNRPEYPRKVEFLAHPVRRGDTLIKIARRYGIKVDPIADLNGVHPRAALQPGRRIILPMPNDRSRSVVSLEVRDPPSRSRKQRRRRRHAQVILTPPEWERRC